MGIPTRTLSVAFDLLVAVTIVLSIKVIGTILVVALLVLPGLSALKLGLSFRKTVLAAIGFSLASTVLGIVLSATLDIATGGLIVFTSGMFFVFTFVYKKLG
jgi:ABC-type Mn2+/Zn2+ transport system permease subunit